jgi:transposase InsO family protein
MPNLEAYTTITSWLMMFTSWIASSTLWNTACTRRSPISIKLALGKSTLSLELTVILESDTTQKKGRKLPSSIVQVLKRGNEKWVTDITEFKLFGEKMYLSPILDLYNGEIITYTVGSRPTYSLVSEMLNKAFKRLSNEDELLLHSEQGWHYQMKHYRQGLKEQAITQSMSRKGNCYDNAVMENFFGIMKSEFFYLREFESVDHFKQELARYMDYYNHKRIKSKLKGMSPVQYRDHAQQVA